MNREPSSQLIDLADVPLDEMSNEVVDHAEAFPRDASSRRSFLGKTAIATGAAAAASLSLGSNARAQGTARNSISRYFLEIQNDENTHVAFLLDALGAAARPRPTFVNLRATSLRGFVELSATFENTGVAAYRAAAPLIQDATNLGNAASIAFVEAYHSGYLNTLLGRPIVPGASPFAEPPALLTFDEVVQSVQPFIVSLNGPPVTAGSDTEILNAALLLEYLEQEYYNINVPRVVRALG